MVPLAMKEPDSRPRLTFAESLEQTLSRLSDSQRSALAVGGSLASLVGLLGPAGCAPEAQPASDVASRTEEVVADGQRDWVQNLGKRDRAMVRYYHEFWRDYSDCGSRFGCASVTVFLKVAVRPVVGADLSYKKVGAVYREVGSSVPSTATGRYFSTHPDGYEEWHIPIKSFNHQGAFLFNAWYEDGKYGRYYDDNNGELYALTWSEPSADYVTIRPDWASSTAKLDGPGLTGRLYFVVEDLDYDKDLSLEWSTDEWATKNSFGMGASGATNKLYWDSNLGRDFDRWAIDLDLPGGFPTFRFRLVYRHGVVSGADVETFVGGGASGYLIQRPPSP